jgi:hypothetical protein
VIGQPWNLWLRVGRNWGLVEKGGLVIPDGGARSATLERMSALSRAPATRGTVSSRTTPVSRPWWLTTGWRCEPLSLLTFFAAAKKVSAAPHRGDANKPTRKQGKANTLEQTAKQPTPTDQQESKEGPTPWSKQHREKRQKPNKKAGKGQYPRANSNAGKRKKHKQPNKKARKPQHHQKKPAAGKNPDMQKTTKNHPHP